MEKAFKAQALVFAASAVVCYKCGILARTGNTPPISHYRCYSFDKWMFPLIKDMGAWDVIDDIMDVQPLT